MAVVVVDDDGMVLFSRVVYFNRTIGTLSVLLQHPLLVTRPCRKEWIF